MKRTLPSVPEAADSGVFYNRKLDELGRIVIPQDIRKVLGWKVGEAISVEVYDERTSSVIIKLRDPHCSLCKTASPDLKQIELGLVCPECIQKLKDS